jgi:chromosome segregation ATPase
MAKLVSEARMIVNETALNSLALKWFAFVKDIEKKPLGETESSLEDLVTEIDSFEFNTSLILSRMQTAQHDVQALTAQLVALKGLINQGNSKIGALKQQLGDARKERKRQEEYDAIAATILEQHDRTTVVTDIKALQDEIAHERQDKVKHDRLLELRSKQFQLLLTTIEDLEEELQGDEGMGMEAEGASPAAAAADPIEVDDDMAPE